MNIKVYNSNLAFVQVKQPTTKNYLTTASSNTQYIDLTSVSSVVGIPFNKLKVETKFVLTDNTPSTTCDIWSTRNGLASCKIYSRKVSCGYNSTSKSVDGVAGTEYNVILDAVSGVASIDGAESATFTPTTSNVTTFAIFANCGNAAVSSATNQAGRIQIKSIKIYNASTNVFNGVPALDGDNKPCLYDTIEKKCYYSADGTDLVVG